MTEDFLEKLVSSCKIMKWLFSWAILRTATTRCSLSVKLSSFFLFIFFFLNNPRVELPASSLRSAAHVRSLMWAWPKVCRHELGRRYAAPHTVTSYRDNNWRSIEQKLRRLNSRKRNQDFYNKSPISAEFRKMYQFIKRMAGASNHNWLCSKSCCTFYRRLWRLQYSQKDAIFFLI